MKNLAIVRNDVVGSLLRPPRLKEARARFATPVADEPTTMDVPAIAAAIRATARAFGDHAVVEGRRCAEIVLCFDQNLLRPAAVLVRGGSTRVIRRRETIEDLLRAEVE